MNESTQQEDICSTEELLAFAAEKTKTAPAPKKRTRRKTASTRKPRAKKKLTQEAPINEETVNEVNAMLSNDDNIPDPYAERLSKLETELNKVPAQGLNNPPKVNVTEEEVRLYMKAMLNNKPVALDIGGLFGSMTVRVRNLSVYEVELLIEAIKTMEITNAQQYELMVGALGVAMQVTHVGGDPVGHSSFPTPADDMAEDITTLINDMRRRIRALPETAYVLYRVAREIFTTKMELLRSHMLSQDFWSPRQTD